MNKFKPCPFCGSINQVLVKDTSASYYAICCGDCAAIGPAAYTAGTAKIDWNTRANEGIISNVEAGNVSGGATVIGMTIDNTGV